MDIRYSKQAFKYLKKQSESDSNRIEHEINKLPDNTNRIKKLSGVDNLYRLRVGDYRVLFTPELERGIINIEKILPRSDVYNGIK
jgi:mRNA interferase RelE/StbE